jgi:hypothetical protein
VKKGFDFAEAGMPDPRPTTNLMCRSVLCSFLPDPILAPSLQTPMHMDRETALLAYLLSQRSNVLSAMDRGPQFDYYGWGIDQVAASQMQLHVPHSSMADRRLSVNLFHNKRLSLGLGGPSDHLLSHSYHIRVSTDKDVDLKSAIMNRYFDASHHSNTFGRSNRRMSNLGALSSSFFEDHDKTARRESIASVASFASVASAHDVEKNESDDASAISEIGHDDREDDNIRQLTSGPIIECAFPALVASDIKEIMEAFTESMMRSQKSQQAIHDWDKKMGLKRSHSKTMRLSMRSRKKLKTMIKKDVGALRL